MGHVKLKNKKKDGLQEKQKLMEAYGLTEKQFNECMAEALKTENKAEYILRKLESRLDNVVYRLGFALNRENAHQLVTHGHVSEKDMFDSPHVKEVLLARRSFNFPSWLKLESNVGYVCHLPQEKELRQEKLDIDKILDLYL